MKDDLQIKFLKIERDELRAEIERLTAENKRLIATTVSAERYTERCLETERLTAALQDYKDLYYAEQCVVAKREATIERLTTELKELGNKRDFCYERLCDERARVEKLESENKELDDLNYIQAGMIAEAGLAATEQRPIYDGHREFDNNQPKEQKNENITDTPEPRT